MSDWYKRKPAKFIGGVVGLGPDVIGAYTIVLDLIYQADGPIANDARWIGGILGCSSRKAAALIQTLVERGKLTIEADGKLSNETAQEVIEERVNTHRERSESGAKGGRNSREMAANDQRNDAEKCLADNESNELDEAELKHLEREKEEKRERKDASAEANFVEWYLAYPKHVGRGQAEKAYRHALKKADPPVLLEAAQKFAAASVGKEPRFIPHPATWLNGERWLDDLSAGQAQAQQSPASLQAASIRARYGMAAQ